jgi:hypothetical protein
MRDLDELDDYGQYYRDSDTTYEDGSGETEDVQMKKDQMVDGEMKNKNEGNKPNNSK